MPYLPIQRTVSTGLQIKLLFGGRLAFFGWLLLLIGMWATYLFADNMGAGSRILSLSKEGTRAEGTVVGIEIENNPKSKGDIFAYTYSFLTDKGKKITNVSRSPTIKLKVGDKVQVLYLTDKPQYSKIKDMNESGFSMFLLFNLLFPVVGAIMAWVAFWRGRKKIYLLKVGELGYGKLLRYEPTEDKIDDRVVQRMFFELEVKGQKYEIETKSHLPEYLTDEPLEVLFYHPNNPKKAILKDALPGHPRLLDAQTLEPTPVEGAWYLLILPILSLLSLLSSWL